MCLEELHFTENALSRPIDHFGISGFHLEILSPFGPTLFGVHIYHAEDMAITHINTFLDLLLQFLEISVLRIIRFYGYVLEGICQRFQI